MARINFRDIANSINKHFQDNLPGVTIKFSGQKFDTARVQSWIHLLIDEDSPPPQRSSLRQMTNIVVTVLIFHKYGDNITAIHGLSDSVANILHHQNVSILSKSGEDCSLTIRFREAVSTFLGTDQGASTGVHAKDLEVATVRCEALVE